MHVSDWQVDLDRYKRVDRGTRSGQDLVIERFFETVILRLHTPPGHARRQRRAIENRGKIEASRFPVIDRRFNVQQVHPAHHLVESAEPKLRHVLANLFREKEEEIDDVLRLPLELL